MEDLKTAGESTHFSWIVAPDLGAFDKLRAAFNADRDKRSQEERDAITASFNGVLDADASRSAVARSLIFKVAPPK